MKKPVKEIEVSIQFLHEVIRTDMFEILIGSANAVFDSVLSYIATLKCPVSSVQVSLLISFISLLHDDHAHMFIVFELCINNFHS